MTTTDPMISCSTKSFGAHDDHAETGIYVCKPEMNPARSSGWNVSFCEHRSTNYSQEGQIFVDQDVSMTFQIISSIYQCLRTTSSMTGWFLRPVNFQLCKQPRMPHASSASP